MCIPHQTNAIPSFKIFQVEFLETVPRKNTMKKGKRNRKGKKSRHIIYMCIYKEIEREKKKEKRQKKRDRERNRRRQRKRKRRLQVVSSSWLQDHLRKSIYAAIERCEPWEQTYKSELDPFMVLCLGNVSKSCPIL